MVKVACKTCNSVQRLAKKPQNGVKVAQRKKNLKLLAAVYLCHKDCLVRFMNEGANVNCTDEAFDFQCRRKIGGEVRCTNITDGCTPLVYASTLGHPGHFEIVSGRRGQCEFD